MLPRDPKHGKPLRIQGNDVVVDLVSEANHPHRNLLKALADIWKRYMVVTKRFDINAPKNHLMLHVPYRARYQGNPWYHATWTDEGLNRKLKAILRACHQATFESQAFAKAEQVLVRDGLKRKSY